MINLISMNLSRLFKSKVFYVTLFIGAAVFFLLTKVLTDPEEMAQDQKIMEEQGYDAEDESVGMVISGQVSEESSLEYVFQSLLGSCMLLMVVGIFSGIFSADERTSGFLKNLTVGKKEKKYIFMSKVPIILLYSIVLIVCCFLATKLGTLGRNPELYHIQNLGGTVKYLVIEVLLHTAFGTFIMVFHELVRNSKITIIFAIFASQNIMSVFLSFFEGKISAISDTMAKIMDRIGLVQYLIVTRVGFLSASGVDLPHVNSLIVAVIAIVVYLSIGACIFSKKDTY